MFIIKGCVEFIVLDGERYVFGVGDVLLLEDIEGEGYCLKVMYNEVRYFIFVIFVLDVIF